MKRFFRNIPWKNILLFTLVTALGIGAIVGIGKVVKAEEKTISSTVFERGALDEEGVYVKTNESIVTKDLIECQGLRIEPDFEATGSFQVFYYYSDKTFGGSTDLMKATDGMYEKGDSFDFAKYCRIVITPDAPKDDNGYVDHDFEIAFYQVLGFANDFTITVDKKQKFDEAGLFFEDDEATEDMVLKYVPAEGEDPASFSCEYKSGYTTSGYINVTEIKQLKLVYPLNSDGVLNYMFIKGTSDSDGNFKICEGLVKFAEVDNELSVISVPSDADYFVCSYKIGAEIGIYKVS